MQITGVLRDLTCQLQALLRGVSRERHLTLTQAQILLNLPVDGLPLSSLAHRLGLDISTISRIIDNMVKRQWVQRVPVPEDRRINRVVPTAAGTRLYHQLTDGLESEVKSILSGLDASRLETLGQDLEDLTWRMMQHRT